MRLTVAGLALLLPILAPVPASAQTGCTRSVVKQALADGKEIPHVTVDCPGSETQGLLASDAAETVCAGARDPGTLEA